MELWRCFLKTNCRKSNDKENELLLRKKVKTKRRPRNDECSVPIPNDEFGRFRPESEPPRINLIFNHTEQAFKLKCAPSTTEAILSAKEVLMPLLR